MNSLENSITAIYPGTFDPITNGHLDIIIRAAKFLCQRLIVSVAVNPGKNPLFSVEQRVSICQEVISQLDQDLAARISVVPFDNLLIKHVKEMEASLIVRGLRAVSDFEYEFQMAGMNARQTKEIETVFLMAGERSQFISSRFVKEIHLLGGDVSTMVPKIVLDHLAQKQQAEPIVR